MMHVSTTGRVVGLAVAAALIGIPVAADAQKTNDQLQGELDAQDGTDAVPVAPVVLRNEGEYGGVVPGRAPEGKTHRKAGKSKRLVLSWIGFQPRAGGSSRIFVQLTREAEFDQEMVGNKLVVTVYGARFASRNARRRLDTRFFDTSVRDVVPKAVRGKRGKRGRRAGVQLAISFKNPSDARTASAQVAAEQDGYNYLYLDFGPGTASPAGADSDADK
jgi:hypothetical protein